jgi:hypothetical protein
LNLRQNLDLRALNPADAAEIEQVAQGMRATLIEVEGEALGASLHSLDWLRERVRWHLDHPCAAVWLALQGEAIVGHSLVRAEPPGLLEQLPGGDAARWGPRDHHPMCGPRHADLEWRGSCWPTTRLGCVLSGWTTRAPGRRPATKR